jgi:DNA-binding LacI/PurR family transcriptional regulator
MNQRRSTRTAPRGHATDTRTTVTQRDIARRCGLSLRVVTAILGGKQSPTLRYSLATRERVLRTAQTLGYRPNRTARNVRRGRHGHVGVLVGDINYVPPLELQLMIEAARERDWLLTIEHVVAGQGAPILAREDCVDGLLVFQTMDRALLRQIAHTRVPLVQINTNNRRGIGSITYDEEGAIEQIAARLAHNGRRYPGLIVGARTPPHYSDRVRATTLRNAARRHGLAPPRVGYASEAMSAYRQCSALLAAQPALDAMIVHAGALVPGVYRAVYETGRSIAKDVDVISFFADASTIALWPRPTILQVDACALVHKAFVVLDEMIAGRRAVTPLTLPYTLVSGDSM